MSNPRETLTDLVQSLAKIGFTLESTPRISGPTERLPPLSLVSPNTVKRPQWRQGVLASNTPGLHVNNRCTFEPSTEYKLLNLQCPDGLYETVMMRIKNVT
jgi:hypothetical protein